MYFRLRPVPDDSGGIFWCHWWHFLVPVVVFALLRLGKIFVWYKEPKTAQRGQLLQSLKKMESANS